MHLVDCSYDWTYRYVRDASVPASTDHAEHYWLQTRTPKRGHLSPPEIILLSFQLLQTRIVGYGYAKQPRLLPKVKEDRQTCHKI